MKEVIKKGLAILSLIGLTLFPAGSIEANKGKVTSKKAPAKKVKVVKKTKAKKEALTVIPVEKLRKPISVIPPKPTKLYEASIQPLSTAECARCHYAYFKAIKEKGGRHKLDCTFCHKKFHAYNPVKKNWKEIMPKCADCHTVFHGTKYADCLACHKNPHAIKIKMAVTPGFAKICGDCHQREMGTVVAFPSKHKEIGCTYCHAKVHGYIPSCLDCHKPHVAGQTVKECYSCHSPHAPLRIPPFAKGIKNEVCGACHKTEAKKIEITKSKHHEVACVDCHTKHKWIPRCTMCHKQPHSPVMLKKFPNCLDCHIDVHNLPTARR